MHTVHKFHWFSTETTSTGIYEAYQHSQIREPTQCHACIAFQLHLQHGVAARNFGNKDRNIIKFMQHDRFCFEWFYVMQHCHPPGHGRGMTIVQFRSALPCLTVFALTLCPGLRIPCYDWMIEVSNYCCSVGMGTTTTGIVFETLPIRTRDVASTQNGACSLLMGD